MNQTVSRLSLLGLVVFVFFAMAPAAHAGVGDRVTGGAEEIQAGSVIISITANAIEMLDKDGVPKGIKGSVQYTREDADGKALIVHSPAECLFISADGLSAEIAGPAVVHENTVGISTDDWFIVGIREGGTGAGDTVRAGFIPAGDGCTGAFVGACSASGCPGLVLEGEFKIRPVTP